MSNSSSLPIFLCVAFALGALYAETQTHYKASKPDQDSGAPQFVNIPGYGMAPVGVTVTLPFAGNYLVRDPKNIDSEKLSGIFTAIQQADISSQICAVSAKTPDAAARTLAPLAMLEYKWLREGTQDPAGNELPEYMRDEQKSGLELLSHIGPGMDQIAVAACVEHARPDGKEGVPNLQPGMVENDTDPNNRKDVMGFSQIDLRAFHDVALDKDRVVLILNNSSPAKLKQAMTWETLSDIGSHGKGWWSGSRDIRSTDSSWNKYYNISFPGALPRATTLTPENVEKFIQQIQAVHATPNPPKA